MVKESMAFLQQADPQVAEAIGLELKRRSGPGGGRQCAYQ